MVWTPPVAPTTGTAITVAYATTNLVNNLKAIGDAWTAWTPTVTAETGTFTTVSGSGQYIAAGKLIVWNLGITVTTIGTAANGLRFTLPVTARAANCYIGNGRNATNGFAAQVLSNTTTQGTAIKYDNTTIISTGSIMLSGTYEAA